MLFWHRVLLFVSGLQVVQISLVPSHIFEEDYKIYTVSFLFVSFILTDSTDVIVSPLNAPDYEGQLGIVAQFSAAPDLYMHSSRLNPRHCNLRIHLFNNLALSELMRENQLLENVSFA
jgi:hypothetical protein